MDIVTLGELLIDFTPAGVSASGMALYERNPGGAPANVAAAAARLGLKTAFIGKVGEDLHGRFLKSVLQKEGVNVSGLVLEKALPTTLAFVELSENMDRDFSFVRKGCGDTQLTPEEVSTDLIRSAKIFHVGTLSLTDEPARTATYFAVKTAHDAGVTVSCDINWRPSLWDGTEDFLRVTEGLLPCVDLLKVSGSEAELLTGNPEYKEAAGELLNAYKLRAVAVTLGENGAYLLTPEDSHSMAAYPAEVIDTTGAGDCFWAAFLYNYLITGRPGPESLRFGCAAASISIERRGAIPAMPTYAEVINRL